MILLEIGTSAGAYTKKEKDTADDVLLATSSTTRKTWEALMSKFIKQMAH